MGARSALVEGRASRARLLLAVCGMAAVVLVLLAAAGAHSVVDHRADASVARSPVTADIRGGDAATGIYVLTAQDTWHGRPVTRVLVDFQAASVHPVPTPPGLKKLPGPGRCAVSPALRDLLTARPDSASLRERYCGGSDSRSEVISADGLLEPGELMAYVGTRGLAGDPDADQITAFGAGRIATQVADADTSAADRVLLAVVGVLTIPLILMVTTSTRLAGRARARRLAALRLAGASERQAATVLSGEILAVALAGVLLAWVAFSCLRVLSTGWTVADYGWYPGAAQPGLTGILVSVLVPWLAVRIARREARSALRDPYSARRADKVRTPRFWAMIPLLTGMALLGYLIGFGGPRYDTFVSPAQMTVLYTALVLSLAGLAWFIPALTRGVARPFARRADRVWMQLAGRQIRAGAGPVTRSVAALAIVMVTAGSAQLAVGTLRQSEGYWLEEQLATPAGRAVSVEHPSKAVLAAAKGHVPGARAALTVRRYQAAATASGAPSLNAVLVADCHWIDTWLGRHVPACRQGAAMRITQSGLDPDLHAGASTVFTDSSAGTQGTTFTVVAPRAVLDLPAVDGAARLDATLLLPPDSPALRDLPQSTPGLLLVFPEKRSTAEDSVRGGLLAADPHAQLDSTSAQLHQIRAEITPLVVATTGTTVAVCVLLLGVLIIAAFDAALSRARTTGLLVATGAPARTLRLAQAFQLLLPTAAAACCALSLHVLVNLAITQVTRGGVGFSFAAVGVLGGVGLAGLVVAVVPALVVNGAKGDTELLRAG